MQNYKIYFENESPDWNFMIEKGDIKKIAANRVIIAVMTEYGICNNCRMSLHQYSEFIFNTQMITCDDKVKSRCRKKKRYVK